MRAGHAVLLTRVWDLRDRLTPYDAAYLALAESPGDDGRAGTLVTTDARFAWTIGTVHVVVVPVS